METLRFKTNIKCAGCIASATPILDTLNGIDSWKVDINSPEKILTIETSGQLLPATIKESLSKKGFSAELI